MEYGLVLVWLATYLALGLAALPVAAALFPRLADRGAGVALPLALVLVTVPAYWVGHVAFGWPALLAGLVVLVGASVVARRRFDAEPDWVAARDAAVVFAAAFGFLVAVRAVDPAVHPIYGEKFLDFGLLKSLLRATALPPEDMWFAGEPVSYYYGGHLVASLLTILTGTAANYAYNLALAGFYAMLVTAAFGVGGAIGRARGASRRGAGLASAFFVGFASNLATTARAVAGVLPTSLLSVASEEKAETFAKGLDAFTYWPASRAMEANVITEFPLFAWLNGDLHAHMMSTPFALLVVALLLAYYRTPEGSLRRRRLLVFGAVPVVGGLLAVVNTWSLPTVGGLTALALFFAPSDPTTLLPERVGRPVRALADADGVAADGGTSPVGVAGLVDGSLARLERVARTEGVRGGTALAGAAVVLLSAVVLVVPFFLGPASTREVALWEASRRSGTGGLLVAHGGFLLVFVAFLRTRVPRFVESNRRHVLVGLLVVLALGIAHGFAAFGLFAPLLLVAWVLLRTDASREPGEASPEAEPVGQDTEIERVAAGLGVGLVLVGTVLVVGLEGWPLGIAIVASLLPLAGVVVGIQRNAPDRDRDVAADGTGARPTVGFESVLLVAGVGLVLVVEVLYVVEEAGPGRFNTVFKTYAQVWPLWGTAAGAMFAALVRERVLAPMAAARPDGGDDDGSTTSRPSMVAVVAAVLLVGSLSLYGGLALNNHFTGTSVYPRYQTVEDPTLNATAFVEDGHGREAAAIRWLDRREGNPTIVTAAPGGYTWRADQGKGASAPASLTGLPTVAGWFHERGYRGGAVFGERVDDVETIYTGSAENRSCLLARYDVRYVYVGPAERAQYGTGVQGFQAVEGVGEPLSFADGAVLVYPVDQSALPESSRC